MNPFCKYGFLETDPASLRRKFPFLLRFLQVSVLSKEHEKDSFRLSWGAEHLDNVVLSSSLLHSGYTNAHTHSHARTHVHTLYCMYNCFCQLLNHLCISLRGFRSIVIFFYLHCGVQSLVQFHHRYLHYFILLLPLYTHSSLG